MRSFSLADLFEIVADALPEREALVAGDARRTYAELDERATRLGNHLRSQGLATGDHVGIMAWNSAEWVEAMLGCWKARLVPINVNYRYVEDELRYLFDNADLVALILDQEFLPRVEAVRGDLPRLRHLLPLGDAYEAAVAVASPARAFGERSGDDLYILYTGGTTGMPKGTLWRQEDIFFAAMGGGGNYSGTPIGKPEELAERAQAGTPAAILCAMPLMHGGGQWVTVSALSGGNKIVLYPGHRFDADAIWRLVERERVAVVSIIGDAMARPLAEALGQPGASYDTSSLVIVGSGGAILSSAVKEQLRAQLPNTILVDSFGASESGFNGTVMDMGGAAGGPRFTMNEVTSVLDDELRRVAPGSGVVGRVARRGRIPLGYYKDPEKTATIFAEVDGERWVLPGDFATVEADGTITVLGRGSVCINSGGEKIFPEEVEAALKSHAEVFDAVVVGLPDERWGERVVAVVQPRPGTQPTLDDLAEHCRARVAGYKIPRQLVVLDEIVRTPVGKPDYRWARAAASDAVSA